MFKRPKRPRRNLDPAFRPVRSCRFCHEPIKADYKDVPLLQRFITERGKIMPSRISGNCASHQRELTRAIKKARVIALLPFVAE